MLLQRYRCSLNETILSPIVPTNCLPGDMLIGYEPRARGNGASLRDVPSLIGRVVNNDKNARKNGITRQKPASRRISWIEVISIKDIKEMDRVN